MKSRSLSSALSWLIVLCVVPLLLVAVWLAFRSVRDLDEWQMQGAGSYARSVAAAVDHLIEDRTTALQVLAASPLVDDERRWPELYADAQRFQAAFGSHVSLTDPDIRMLFNTRLPYGAALPDAPRARGYSAVAEVLRTGRPSVGDVIIGPAANRPLVAIVVPVVREGVVRRLMFATIDLSWLQSRLEKFDLPEGWSVALVDSTGVDIARRSPPGFDSRRDVDPSHRIGVKVANTPWSIALEIPRAIDQAARNAEMALLAALVLGAVLAGTGGGWWTSRRIGAQVAQLGAAEGSGSQHIEISEIEAARQRISEATARIKDSEGQLRLWGEVFRNAGVGVAISDARRNEVLSVNAAFARQRGYTEAELVGRSVMSLFPARCRKEAREKLLVADTHSHAVFESEHERRDGSCFPVLIDLTVTRDEAGNPLNRLGMVLDISDRKRAEHELAVRRSLEMEQQRKARIALLNLMDDTQAARREAEDAAEELRKLSQAVEQSVESIEITDLNARITYVNEAYLRQTGYTREEVIGQNPRLLQSGNTPRHDYVAMWKALGQGKAWKGELYNRRKDGSEYVEFASITPIRRPDGQVSHYVAVKEDITERRRMGAELDTYRHHLEELVAERTTELERAREQAEAANRAKSTFLASMSHEIRTPMNAILGFTQLLQRDAASSLDVDRLGKIEAAARHLLGVINDILDMSKIEAGRIELESHDFALEAVLGHVATLIGEDAAAKGLAVRVDGDHVPHWLRGDLTRLRQALLNLAGNAVKFTERGSIALRARLVESRDNRHLVRFEVDDTGVGVPADVLPELFQAFHQADSSTTRRFGGTGLGLYITRQLARAMGGEAGADSTPGCGSRFWFTAWLERGVPAKAAASAPGATPSELQRRHAGARVLLAEDHALNREVATDLLASAGLVVDAAENGRIAVEKARTGAYDLILMDMLMPEMDGITATRAIRQTSEGRRVPIIAMTANAFEEDRQRCREAGMDDFISKPVDLKALYSTVDKWLTSSRASLPANGAAASAARGTTLAPERSEDTLRIMSRLTAEAGIDPDKGLAFLGGREQKLVGLLRAMAVTHRNDMHKIRECLRQGGHAEALRITHTLRGVTAMLGANELFGALGALEVRLRQGQGVPVADLEDLIGAADRHLGLLLEIVGAVDSESRGAHALH